MLYLIVSIPDLCPISYFKRILSNVEADINGIVTLGFNNAFRMEID